MEARQAIIERRIRQRRAAILAEFLVELAVSAFRWASDRIEAAAQARRRLSLRRELHGMSDHMLRDIGVERSRIDALFH